MGERTKLRRGHTLSLLLESNIVSPEDTVDVCYAKFFDGPTTLHLSPATCSTQQPVQSTTFKTVAEQTATGNMELCGCVYSHPVIAGLAPEDHYALGAASDYLLGRAGPDSLFAAVLNRSNATQPAPATNPVLQSYLDKWVQRDFDVMRTWLNSDGRTRNRQEALGILASGQAPDWVPGWMLDKLPNQDVCVPLAVHEYSVFARLLAYSADQWDKVHELKPGSKEADRILFGPVSVLDFIGFESKLNPQHWILYGDTEQENTQLLNTPVEVYKKALTLCQANNTDYRSTLRALVAGQI